MGERPRVPAPQGLIDFDLLPRRKDGGLAVLPTTVRLLEQNGDLLIYHPARGTEITAKKNQIFHRLVQIGEHPDADCKITVLVVQGNPGEERCMMVYDFTTPRGSQPVWHLATDDDIQQFIRKWFDERA